MITEKNRRIGLLIVAVVIAAVITVIGNWTYSKFTKSEKLDSIGQKTKGLLDEEYIETKSRFGSTIHYKVTYQFDVNGKSYEGSAIVSNKPIFRNVNVIYEPDDPTNNRLERDESQNLLGAKISLACLALILIVLIAEWVRSFRKRI